MTGRLAFAALALAVSFPAAAGRQEPSVEYAADSSAETAQGAIQGRVFHARGMERREMNQGGQRMVTIVRKDRKVVWVLVPEEKAYMEVALGTSPDPSDVSGWEVEQSVVGPEELDGVKTTKTKVIMKSARGDKMGGFWWTTADGVAVKMDMLSVEKGSKTRMKLELKNLKVGKQDPSLFEIPSGYQAMGMPGLGSLPGVAGKAPPDRQKGSEERKLPAMPSVKDLGKLFR